MSKADAHDTDPGAPVGLGWGATLAVEILKQTPPESAIKIAYDFARTLRDKGADAHMLPSLLDEWVERPHEGNLLLPYIRAGFIAGFNNAPLPWRRQIEAQRS